jgi:hypothetical protein
LDNLDELLSWQRTCRKTFAGYDHQWVQSFEEWRVLPELKLEFSGFCNYPLVFDSVGAVKGHFAWDELVQLLGVVVSGIKGKCVWGEVFAGLEENQVYLICKKIV